MTEKKEEKSRHPVSSGLPLNLNVILVGLLVVAAFLIGTLYTKVQLLEKGTSVVTRATDDSAQVPPAAESPRQIPEITADNYIRGSDNAEIALIEFSDFECPFCKRFHPTAQQAVDEYQGKVMWVYMHFPLDQIHPKARKSAEAAECAGSLGGNDSFWELTDKIFEAMPEMSLADLPKLAAEVGLNQNEFKECLDSGKFAQRVEDDYQKGVRAGITGTPGNILLNLKTGESKLLPGAVPYETLKSAIDELLQG